MDSSGGSEADMITGGAGNDLVTAGFGDSVDGGIGTDTLNLDFFGSSDGLTADFSGLSGGGTVTAGGATIQGIEYLRNLYLGDGADIVTTGPVNPAVGYNETYGYGGNDRLTGGAGDNLLYGGDGNDQLFGLADDDYLTGNEGDDMLDGGTGDDQLRGEDGIDSLIGGVGNDSIDGGNGNDTLDGGANDDFMYGGIGNDILTGGANNDTLYGNEGNDTASYRDAASMVRVTLASSSQQNTLGAGNDTLFQIENLEGSASADTLTGNGSANILAGLAGNDTLTGANGNDTLDGGTGADTMTGGADNDIYVVDDTGDVLTELTGEGIDTVQTTLAAYTLLDDFENIAFTGTGGFAGIGNAAANTISGGAGGDVLDGAGGADMLAGGAGNDTYLIDALDTVVEQADEGVDEVRTALASYTLGANVEGLTFTGAGAFAGTGNDLNNTITGGTAGDTLSGGDGKDTLDGGEGDDTLDGGAGDDVLRGGGAGLDMQSGGAGDDAIFIDRAGDLVAGETYDGGADDDTLLLNIDGDVDLSAVTLTGIEGIDQTYYAHDTRLTAAQLDAVSRVSGQSFTLTGGGAVSLAGATITAATFVLSDAGNAFDLTGATTTGVLTVEGGAGADSITGTAAADTLRGNDGDDRLDGGGGADTMTGGAGDDTYVVDDAGDRVIEVAGGGYDTVESAIEFRLGKTFEALALTGDAAIGGVGTKADNVLIGNSAANALRGLAGTDTLTGGGGDDRLDGGKGADAMDGGAGDDTYLVDSTSDTVVELAGAGIDSVRATIDYVLGSDVENLVLAGSRATAPATRWRTSSTAPTGATRSQGWTATTG